MENMTAIPIVEAASLTVNAVPLPPSRYRPNMGYALDSERNMATAKLDPKTRPTKVWKAVCSFVFTLQRLHRKFKSSYEAETHNPIQKGVGKGEE